MYNANQKKTAARPTGKSGKMVSKKATAQDKKSKKKGKKGGEKSSSSSSGGGLFGPRAMQIYGVLLMVFSVLLVVSLVSYFVHHSADSSHVASSEVHPENVAGTVGAHLAYFFGDCCMGIFSVGFAFLFLLYGIRLTFGKSILPLFRTTVATLLTMSWLSVSLGVFVYQSAKGYFAGDFGNYLSELLIGATGKLMAILILIAFLLIIMILCFNFSMSTLLKIRLPKRNAAEDDEEGEEAKSEKKRRRWFGGKDEEEEEQKFEPQTDDTKLSDLYITNKNELSEEYRGKVFHFGPSEPEKKEDKL